MERKKRVLTEEHKNKIRASLIKSECSTRFKKGHINYWKGKQLPEETKKKISEAHRGKVLSDEHKEKLRITSTGRKQTQESIEKTRLANTGKPKSPEARKKMSDFQKARMAKPEEREKRSAQLMGHVRSIESRIKQGASMKGHEVSEKTRASARERCGEKSALWNGGSSFKDYCPKFNNEFKERVRAFWGNRCGECGCSQPSEYRLHVHHVMFDKKTCCNDEIPLFVPLCHGCHSKTNFNRAYWKSHFVEMINTIYGGKCYFTREEMLRLKQGMPENSASVI